MNGWRKLRWVIPEAMNYLRFPSFVFRQWRRDEVAEYFLEARKKGISWISGSSHPRFKLAPKKINEPLAGQADKDCSVEGVVV